MSGSITIVLLGTGSPLPDPHRAGPSTLVQGAGVNLLVDAGRGVVMRLSAAGVLPVMLNAVLLTHLHSDHICDLNDVITTHWVMTSSPTPLAIYGPPGTRQVVDKLLEMLEPDVGYRLAHHNDLTYEPAPVVNEVIPGDVFTIGGFQVRVGETDHRPVAPTVAYRVEIDATSVVLAGDGVPCATLDELLVGATAYVQTAIREDLVKLVPSARFNDILDYHSSVAQAADSAQRAQVATLILTHYVPAPALGQYDEWRGLATAFTGQLILGDDLTSVTIESA